MFETGDEEPLLSESQRVVTGQFSSVGPVAGLLDSSGDSWKAEVLSGGILYVIVAGRGGIGSGGNPDGVRIEEWIRRVLVEHHNGTVAVSKQPTQATSP